MSELRRSFVRLSPRRHDAGAALMRKFRSRPSTAANSAKLQLRVVDALHGLMLTMICFTAAIVLNDEAGQRWRDLLQPATPAATSPLASLPLASASRTAPAEPATVAVPAPSVRLTFLEEESPTQPLLARPATLSTELRVADEEPASESARSSSQAARPPLRAALDLGDQALRTLRR